MVKIMKTISIMNNKMSRSCHHLKLHKKLINDIELSVHAEFLFKKIKTHRTAHVTCQVKLQLNPGRQGEHVKVKVLSRVYSNHHHNRTCEQATEIVVKFNNNSPKCRCKEQVIGFLAASCAL